MKRILLILGLLVGLAGMSQAQDIRYVRKVASLPSSCTTNISMPVAYQGLVYNCIAGVYTATSSGGGSISGLTATRVPVAASATTLTDYAGFTHDGTTLTVAGLKDTGLTSGRVPFATTGGLLTDSANFTWDGELLSAIASTATKTYQARFKGSSDTTYGYIGQFSNSLYFSTNIKWNSGWTQDDATLPSWAFNWGGTADRVTWSRSPAGSATLTTNFYLGANGVAGVYAGTSPGASWQVNAFSSTTIGQIIKLAASQSADALQVQNSSGTILTSIAAGGALTISDYSGGATSQIGITRETSDSSGTMIRSLVGARLYLDGYNTVLRSHAGTEWLRVWQTGVVTLTVNQDIGFSRNAAGILEINNGTAGTFRDLRARYIGAGVTPSYPLHLVGTDTNAAATYLSRFIYTPQSTSSGANYNQAVNIDMKVGVDSGINNSGYQTALFVDAYTGSAFAGTLNYLWSVVGRAFIGSATQATGVVSSAVAFRSEIDNAKSGTTITAAYGLQAVGDIAAGSTIGTYFGVSLETISNAGTFTTDYGMRVRARNASATNYGIYIENSTSATTNYSIYSAGGASLLNAGTSTVVPLTLKGAASQSADLTQWQNSSGAKQLWVNADGISISWLGSGSIRGIGSNTLYINDSTNAAGYAYFLTQANGIFQVRGDMVIAFSGSTSNAGTASDAALSRISAGLIGVGTGAAGSVAGSMSMTNLTLAGVANMAAGSVSAPSINFTDTATGFYRTGTNAVGVTLNGVNGLRFDPNYGILFRSDYYAAWASSTAYAAADVGILRSGVNTIKISDASSGFGDLTLRGITMSGNFFAGPSTIESFTTNASALGTLNYYTDSQTIYYDTAAATADVTLNVDASASVDLNTRLATGQMVTVVLALTNTGTAYKCNTLQVHSVGQTIKWVGGSAPTGTANSVDFYTFTIMKTGASTYYVTGSKTSYS